MATLDGRFISRILFTMTSAPPPAPSSAVPLSDAEYSRLAHAVLAAIEATVDHWLEDDVVDIDSQRTGGLLELSLPGAGGGSKIILNTQPPLQEIWLAAKAGGYHFKHVAGEWLDTRDGSNFLAVLSSNVSSQAGCPLLFSA